MFRTSIIAVIFIASNLALLADEERSGEITIHSIMEDTHEGKHSLANKAKRGEANEKEMHELIAVYKALFTLEPPRGSKNSWKKKTGKVYKEATRLQKAKDLENTSRLSKALDCKSCHKAHKPKDDSE